MGEDDPTSETEEAPISITPHDPLPLPPEVKYSRPIMPGAAGRYAQKPGDNNQYEINSSDKGSYDAVRHGAGLAGGVSLAASVFAGYWLGAQIDQRWIHSATPWGTIVMILAGTYVGFYNMIRLLNRPDRTQNKK